MEFFGSINAVYVMIGSLVLGAAGGMLGSFAVLRKQGLLGDALAHASLPGIAVAFLIMEVKFLPGLLLGALVSGLIGAFLIYLLVTQSKIKMDTAMASILSVFFGIGILLLTYIQKLPISSQSGLDSFLFGRAAALLRQDVVMICLAFAIILLVVVVFWKELKLFIFDQQFAKVLGFKTAILEFIFMSIFVVAILMSLQAVGVVLTAALFITPSVAAFIWSNRLFSVVLLSTVFGMLAGGSGAYLSSVFAKTPTGPVIVVVSTVIFAISFFFAPKKGVLSVWRSYKRHSLKIQRENILARLYRDVEKGVEGSENLYKRRIVAYLRRSGLVNCDGGKIFLTDEGVLEAKKVIEKHRLWETYLVHRLNLAPDHVHRDAEEMEHVLTDEMVAKLRKVLKNPQEDPHGKPIK